MVQPLHNQVQFGDALAEDYPQWETGEERAVFDTHTIVVATRGDQEGDVKVEIWIEPTEQELGGLEVLDTEVQLVGDMAHFGNFVAGQLFDVSLNRGWYRVRVLVDPTDAQPSLVRFIVQPSEAGDGAFDGA
jgi:hypothetical protein